MPRPHDHFADTALASGESPTDEAVSVRWLPSAARSEAERIWERLDESFGRQELTCCWGWTATWLEHYGDVVPHRFAVGEAAGRPCGIALVTSATARRGPFRLRSVHLGTAGEPPGESIFVEYNRIRVEPGLRSAFAASLIGDLRRDGRWHELRLDGFAPEDAEPLLDADPLLAAQPMESPVNELQAAGSGDAGVLGALKSRTRGKVRRTLEAIGDIEAEWAEDPEHARDILDELIDLHQRRWSAVGEPGAFASPRFAAFHRRLVPRLLPSRAVILFRVRARVGTVGCLYHFVDRGRVLFYQSGFASCDDRRLTPGFVAFASCMQACRDRGLAEYDFLVGDGRYKRDLSTTSRQLIWATGRHPARRWQLIDRLAAARRRLRARD